MKPVDELTFTDDYMFGYVMRNEEICKGLLERLLQMAMFVKSVAKKLYFQIRNYYPHQLNPYEIIF